MLDGREGVKAAGEVGCRAGAFRGNYSSRTVSSMPTDFRSASTGP